MTHFAQNRPCRSSRRCQIFGMLLLLCGCVVGCSTTEYRLRADHDAACLVEQKAKDPRWHIDRFSIGTDPRSRMHDPYDPDHEPMPPDDPTAHKLLHCIDCKRGDPCWHTNGDTPFVENPSWKGYLSVDEQGEIKLDRRAAVEMALLQSPDYQSQLEELYLAALDVSFERFRFDTQFFAGIDTFFTVNGPRGPTELAINSSVGPPNGVPNKLFASGAELIVGLANSLIWEFSGPNKFTAPTLLNYSFIQPLLRGGSRAVVLERLTLAERSLLANVRQLQRFRQGFYTDIVTGAGDAGNLRRPGGLGGGSGLEGFSGVGAGGFGRLGAVGGGGGGGTGAGQAGGYLGLLQNQQEIRNLETNIRQLTASLAELQAKYDAGGRIDFFQVELARQALYNAQSRLLNRNADYESSLDEYKIQLGLPPDTPMVVEDPLLDRFKLIDARLTEAQSLAERVLNTARDPDWNADDEQQWSELLGDSQTLLQRVGERLESVRTDLQSLAQNLPARRTNLRRLGQRPQVQAKEVAASAYNIEKLNRRAENYQQDYAKLVRRAEAIRGRLEGIHSPVQLAQMIEVLTEMSTQLGDILLLQARTRLDTIVLTPIDVPPEVALQVARENRLDWMNARAALVDAWTLIKFNANALESQLDLVVRGEVRDTGAGPLEFGVEFDAPITRLAERNSYRQALIEYQQARRNFYTFVDRVNQGLRDILRNVQLNQLNFELRREAVQLAISQVELAQLQIEEPPKVGVEVAGSDNRVQNLVNSLNELLDAQNDILSIWVTYEVLRLQLAFQMGTMQLDDQGQWLDPGPIRIAPPAASDNPDES